MVLRLLTVNDFLGKAAPLFAIVQAHIWQEDEFSLWVRECFDALFYRLDRVACYHELGIIRRRDLHDALEHFVERLAEHKKYWLRYLDERRLPTLVRFLDLFEAWRRIEVK